MFERARARTKDMVDIRNGDRSLDHSRRTIKAARENPDMWPNTARDPRSIGALREYISGAALLGTHLIFVERTPNPSPSERA